MKRILLFSIAILFLSSCSRIKEKTKNAINKSGETVGKSATEFIQGVSEGVEKTLECEIKLSAEIKENGLKTGQFTIASDTNSIHKNCLSIYLLFEKDFKRQVLIKALNRSGLEIGRVHQDIEMKSGDAAYFDFIFDKRTDIKYRSVIIFE